ncbi:MAG: hypothetical protein IJ623_01605, partial [Bacteroidales bacterium]|nr:hypothetical protein [Bacteroidales bacterium]
KVSVSAFTSCRVVDPTIPLRFQTKKTMGMQENSFTEMAFTRYQRTWRGFEALFQRGGSATLSAYCKSVHVSYEGMKKWVSASGLSVRRLKQSRRDASSPAVATEQEEPLTAFMQFIPSSVPAASEPLQGVHISFPDGVSLTLQACTPEGIVTLLDTYARRRSAREAECSR